MHAIRPPPLPVAPPPLPSSPQAALRRVAPLARTLISITAGKLPPAISILRRDCALSQCLALTTQTAPRVNIPPAPPAWVRVIRGVLMKHFVRRPAGAPPRLSRGPTQLRVRVPRSPPPLRLPLITNTAPRALQPITTGALEPALRRAAPPRRALAPLQILGCQALVLTPRSLLRRKKKKTRRMV